MNSLDTEEPLGHGERWAALEALTTVVAAIICLVGRRFTRSNTDVTEEADAHPPAPTALEADIRVRESDISSERAVATKETPLDLSVVTVCRYLAGSL